MDSLYRQGVDDCLDAMYDYLDRLDLKSRQCKELCVLMNMIGEWNNQNEYWKNIKFAKQKIEEVRMNFLMLNPKYSLINHSRN